MGEIGGRARHMSSEDKSGLCHLYRHSMNVKCLLPEELERMARGEDERMGAFGIAPMKRE